mmetsp:Transcript_7199/g.11340  ORF Transcript_7199/g.11340 Transcript_7199/m.11340 type:complete len:98 (+) Transcript_7199:477-770(+)
MICINCDSFLSPATPDYCAHCCFYYDRKPGAVTGGVSTNGALVTLTEKEKTGPTGPKALQTDQQITSMIMSSSGDGQNTQLQPNNPVLAKMPPKKLI